MDRWETEWRLELRIAPRQQMMHRPGKRIEVRPRLHLAQILLRRSIANRAYLRAAPSRRKEARDSEVDQHRASVLVDHDVARLQVAINDRRFLRMEKCVFFLMIRRPP